MAEVALFHHAQGLTPGVVAFAEELRRAGHTVHAPDLYDGRTFATLEEGAAHAKEIGFGEFMERGLRAVEGLPAELVYAGFSLGVLPAQRLAQTRPRARGALLFHACLPVSEFGSSWPAGVPVQIQAMEADPQFDNGGTSPPPTPSSRRPWTGSCSSTPEAGTSSPTALCRRTTRTPLRSWAGGCWPSSTGSTGLTRREDHRVGARPLHARSAAAAWGRRPASPTRCATWSRCRRSSQPRRASRCGTGSPASSRPARCSPEQPTPSWPCAGCP